VIQQPFLFTTNKNNIQGGGPLAKAKYSFKKHQKEIARKLKKEEKRQRKLDKNMLKPEENPANSQGEIETLQI